MADSSAIHSVDHWAADLVTWLVWLKVVGKVAWLEYCWALEMADLLVGSLVVLLGFLLVMKLVAVKVAK